MEILASLSTPAFSVEEVVNENAKKNCILMCKNDYRKVRDLKNLIVKNIENTDFVKVKIFLLCQQRDKTILTLKFESFYFAKSVFTLNFEFFL